MVPPAPKKELLTRDRISLGLSKDGTEIIKQGLCLALQRQILQANIVLLQRMWLDKLSPVGRILAQFKNLGEGMGSEAFPNLVVTLCAVDCLPWVVGAPVHAVGSIPPPSITLCRGTHAIITRDQNLFSPVRRRQVSHAVLMSSSVHASRLGLGAS
ncbi:hypothetical protein AMTR_s00149p00033050 [Amborella trichopoda]|uniref:Uncharacterized protein n=1 Tax=Amborella trichopoda TaxID=13333 RepID=W1PGX9_AMBTC|nr:hypothetical protein AMTR_s00149p00033050 [Amborella trichopoda]